MPVTIKQNPDQSTPQEITPMQRAAFKMLMESALRRRDSREQRAASVGEEGNGSD